ncbi:MAG: large conductance mechanosensitive channel protein MscL [Ruminococcus sp.]|nr:large conductance mechanosensitive channel protein MscL [Ruminococcus sp.]
MKKLLEEFKAFIMRGNVMDLAVAVIIGGAFQSIITSLCDDLISPLLGMFGGANFDAYYVEILGATFAYGKFLTAVVNFVIMAAVIFLLVKAVNKAMSLGKKPEPEAEPTEKECPYCYSPIHIKATRCPHCTGEIKD